MEIEIKGSELQDIARVFSNITNKPTKIDARKFKIAYALKVISDVIVDAFKDLDNKRVELVKKYGVEDKEKHTIQVPKDKMEIFDKERNELYELPVKLEITPIPLELLVSSGIEINLLELAAIEKFVEKPKEG